MPFHIDRREMLVVRLQRMTARARERLPGCKILYLPAIEMYVVGEFEVRLLDRGGKRGALPSPVEGLMGSLVDQGRCHEVEPKLRVDGLAETTHPLCSWLGPVGLCVAIRTQSACGDGQVAGFVVFLMTARTTHHVETDRTVKPWMGMVGDLAMACGTHPILYAGECRGVACGAIATQDYRVSWVQRTR